MSPATTNTTTAQPTILIVGAGISGLFLALSLLQNGIPVRIIAREKEYRPGQRGSGIMPRTLEFHKLLGVLPDVLEKARSFPPIREYKLPGGTETLREYSMGRPVEPTPDRPYQRPTGLGQDEHEAILRAHLAKYGCHVELGRELLSFEQFADHVVARIATTGSRDGSSNETTEKYQWLIGADGGRSTVRKALKGVTFLGETRIKERMVVGDIHITSGLDREHLHFWGDNENTLVTLRAIGLHSDVYNIVVQGAGADHEKIGASRESFIEAFRTVTGRTDVDFGELVWICCYTPNQRMVNTFKEDRVILVGDSAHTHKPSGGQGMNSCVQDSLNLGWKLALVQKGLASPDLLSTYTLERLPVIAEMLNITSKLTTMAFRPTDAILRQKGDLAQFGVNYRYSPIVRDERVSAEEKAQPSSAYSIDPTQLVRAGDRAPEAPGLVDARGKSMSVFVVIGSAYHTVLVFTTDAAFVARLQASVGAFPGDLVKVVVVSRKGEKVLEDVGGVLVVEDRDGHAATGYGVKNGESLVFVVRPDSFIGAIVKGVEGLEAYFKSIFV